LKTVVAFGHRGFESLSLCNTKPSPTAEGFFI